MKIEINGDFNLKDTITCGQIFRYYEDNDKYIIIIKDRVIEISLNNNNLIVDSNKRENLVEVVKEYFDLNRNYEDINKKIIKNDKNMKDIISSCKGFKVINQDPFETIIEYIISSNNSVKSIRKSLDLIAEKYGEKVLFKNKEYYLFPSPKYLCNVTEEEFRTYKVGFRDKYLVNIIKEINNNNLNLKEINNLSSEELMKKLMSYNGIGTKVSSCICLFSYKRFDVFPIDTWVKKIMLEKYNIKTQDEIKEYAISTYKEYSGLAIQYMFHYKRNK